MKDINNVYYNLTGVSINEQKILWDERGKGYYGEFMVFERLYKNIPGVSKILMNINVPVSGNKTTEIDLLMIHETGLYVFEIKHYKGTIYGKGTEATWTQYFRTRKNEVFKNPIKQNEYHISALRNRFPSVPIYSFIIFTNPECELKVDCNIPNTIVCSIADLISYFRVIIKGKSMVFTLNQIDSLFCDLVAFSPIMNEPITVDSVTIPFYQYINEIKDSFLFGIKQNAQKSKKVIKHIILSCLSILLISVFICFVISNRYLDIAENAEKELKNFSLKFEHVDEFNNGKLIIAEELVTVSNVILTESPDIDNALDFSCTLTYNGNYYGVSIGEDAKIIVILNNGEVKEYDLWNERYPFSSNYNLGSALYNTGEIAPHNFFDINVSDIAYIKLSNLGIYVPVQYPYEIIASGYEIELYSSP